MYGKNQDNLRGCEAVMTSTTTSTDSVPDQISNFAIRFPDLVALSSGRQTLTYKDLDQKSNRFAGYLHRLGVSAGGAVVLCMDRSVDWIVAALGIMKAGAAYVPLDPAWPDSRVRFTALDSAASAVVGPKHRFGRLNIPARIVDPVVDAQAIAAVSAMPMAAPDPASLAYIVYTSGSTGVPKGVEITHANLSHLVRWHCEAFSVTRLDRTSHLAGLGFDAAVWEIWPSLCSGATLCLASDAIRLSAESIQRWMLDERITLGFVPTVYAAPMMALQWPSTTSLRCLLTGGDTLHHTPREPLPFKVVNNYGPAECTVVATSCQITAQEEGLPPIGRAIAGARVYVLDENRRPVADGAIGEIYVGGDGVGRGYRNLPEATAQAFVPDPFASAQCARMYRTGDRALRRPDGALEFRGRVDRQIKIRGQRVELDEIGNTLARHSGLEFAVATTWTSPEGTMHLVAHFLPREKSSTPAESELKAHLRRTLPDYMVPSIFVQLQSLPLTPNGKVDLAKLPEPAIAHRPAEAESPAPASDVEAMLLAIVEDLLGGQPVTADDNLFLCGGHSLFGMQLITRVRAAFGFDLTLQQLFEFPTVSGLASVIQSQPRAPEESRAAHVSIARGHGSACQASAQAPAASSIHAAPKLAAVASPNGRGSFAAFLGEPDASVTMETVEGELKGDIRHSTGVLALHPDGMRTPIIWIHNLAISLAKSLGEDQPFYIATLTASDLAQLGQRPALPAIAACFMRKILEVQPHGPFILGSLCVGSVLVYEIAQQMRAAGHDVKLLLLFDAPTQPYLRSCTSVAVKLAHPRHALHRVMRIGLGKTAVNISKRLFKCIPFSLRIKWFKPDWSTAHEIIENAAFVYDPKPYHGDVLLLLSANAPPHLDFLPGWQAVIRGRLNVSYVNGHHRDFITPQNVGEIAAAMAPYLLAPALATLATPA